MKRLGLCISNNPEMLLHRLADRLRIPLDSPLKAETIVIQTPGMEKWLSMGLAKSHGICANYAFLFPNTFLNGLSQRLFGESSGQDLFEKATMLWRIIDTLPGLLDEERFAAIRDYLADDPGSIKLYQLCRQIADTFDQYQIYRPDMLLDWDSGHTWLGEHGMTSGKDVWQPVLWRKLTETGGMHRAKMYDGLLRALQGQGSIDPTVLPERISVFGISVLPPFYMAIFRALAGLTEVTLYLVSPVKDSFAGDGDPGAGRNPLLLSMGRAGKELFEEVLATPAEDLDREETFVEGMAQRVLSTLQTMILKGREPVHPAGATCPAAQPEDGSVQIHSCHSPMREIEVLYDNLLMMFQEDGDLTPRDIVVMTPDIREYAPYIRAVFDNPYSDAHAIPYAVADIPVAEENETPRAFLGFLRAMRGRFKASEMIDLLGCAPVAARYGFSSDETDLVKTWLDRAGIRWGVDGDHLAGHNLPPYDQNTWQSGFKRLLLGYALPQKGYDLFEGIRPYDGVEGTEAQVLGKLVDFAESLFGFANQFRSDFTLEEWSGHLSGMLDTFFPSTGDYASEFIFVQRAINGLREAQSLSGFSKKVPLEVIRYHLEHSLGDEETRKGFFTGGVTFSSMIPMRGIPFKVVCLIGMNDGVFPRQKNYADFDLIGKYPRPGDRSPRDYDRYLFLKALVAARDRLSISYTGQNIRDNSTIPPSVLVTELAGYLRIQAVTHRLQPFNPRYFAAERGLFSYSRENCDTARALFQERKERVPFVEGSISDLPEPALRVTLRSFCRFFKNPVKYFYNERLGLYLDDGHGVPRDTEVFNFDTLEAYQFSEGLVEGILAEGDTRNFVNMLTVSGQLPHGSVGRYLTYRKTKEMADFFARVQEHATGPLPPLHVEVTAGSIVIHGELKTMHEGCLLNYRPSKVKANDRITTWICHLLLAMAGKDGYPLRTVYVGTDEGFCFNDAQAAARYCQ
jgi:exodeoxyribonuclease V gamma subunit